MIYQHVLERFLHHIKLWLVPTEHEYAKYLNLKRNEVFANDQHATNFQDTGFLSEAKPVAILRASSDKLMVTPRATKESMT
jgi:hypothetical protein